MTFKVGDDSNGKGGFLLELYRKALCLHDDELYDYFLDHAVTLTQSQIGFFHFVSEDQQTIVLTTWNKQALKNCTASYATHYPIEQAGNWADCIRLKRPIVYNNFSTSPNQKGLPEGHVAIERLLSVPIVEDGIVRAIFGVGNKKTHYTNADVVQLDLLANELDKIVKQRQVETELREAKEKYHSLFANMFDGFAYCQMVSDKDGQPQDFICLEVNEAFERIMGTKKEKIIGKKATQVIPGIEKASPDLFNTLARVANTGKVEKIEFFLKQLNIWLSISVYSPQKGYFAAIFENVSQRKNAEEALRESEESLRRSQEMAHLGSWELNVEENKLKWSDEVYRIFGLKPQEFKATYEAFLDFVHPNDRAAVDNAYIHSLKIGEDNYEIEHRIIRKDTNAVRFVHEKCSHIRDESGQVIRSIGMVQDITERKKTEQALRESEEKLQLKLDSVLSPGVELEEQELANIIDVASLQKTMDYLYNVTNMGFALIDLKGNVLVGTGWQDICTQFHRIHPQTLNNCIESDIELSSELKQGEVRLYKCKNNMVDVVTPLFIGGKHVGNVFFGQFFFEGEEVDRNVFVTQAEKYGFDKKEYLAAFDRIPRFSREKISKLMVFYAKLSEIISKLSYSNLKLAKLLSTQKELQLKLEDKAAEVEEYASQMEELAENRAKQLKDSERLAAIGQTAGMVGHDIRNPLQAITGELYLERLEVESLPQSSAKQNIRESIESIEENLVYINKIVADLQDFARPLNPKKEQVEVNASIKEALAMVPIPPNIQAEIVSQEKELQIIADSTMIKRVLVNLIQNAVQAMPKGGTLTISLALNGNTLKIDVQDTGEGIPKEIQAKLFTPLMTTKSKGQGFGLAVVKRVTEAMKGTVTFQSENGKGSKFTLKFPI